MVSHSNEVTLASTGNAAGGIHAEIEVEEAYYELILSNSSQSEASYWVIPKSKYAQELLSGSSEDSYAYELLTRTPYGATLFMRDSPVTSPISFNYLAYTSFIGLRRPLRMATLGPGETRRHRFPLDGLWPGLTMSASADEQTVRGQFEIVFRVFLDASLEDSLEVASGWHIIGEPLPDWPPAGLFAVPAQW